VSEFLVLVGSYPREPVYTVLATVGIVFAALYVLWFYQRTMQGPLRAAPAAASAGRSSSAGGPGSMLDPGIAARRDSTGFPDLSRREIAVLTPLIIGIMVLGFVPGPVLDVINPSVVATMNEVGLADPVGGTAR
jgi:NADH-quinone oxidoreductase subunit M